MSGSQDDRQPPARRQLAGLVRRSLGGRWPTTESDTDRLAACLEPRVLTTGEIVFARGQAPDGVWIVRNGSLEMVGGAPPRVVVGVIAAGGVVGDVPLLLSHPSACTVRAMTAVRAAYLPADAFLGMLDDIPGFARAWLGALALRQARSEQALAGSVGGRAPARMARLLLREARGGTLECSQQTLAAMTGLRRQTVNQVLKEFERDGLLRVGYREVRVLSGEGLRVRARQG